MRVLFWIVVVVAVLLGGLWLGGESWSAGRAMTLIDRRDDVEAAEVTPLREIGRIGLRADQVEIERRIGDRSASLALPWLDLWVPPLAPVELHATLPEAAQLTLDGRPIEMQMQAAELSMRVSPTNNLAMSRAELRTAELGLAGQPLLRAMSAQARLAAMGHDAPQAAGAAYDVTLNLEALDPATLAAFGLPPLVLPGLVGLDGASRVWLSSAPGRGMLQGQRAEIRPVGFRTEGMVLSVGDLQARLVGEVTLDDAGRPTGRLALYSDDGEAWLKAVSDAGMMPAAGLTFGGALLNGLSQFPMEAAPKADAPVADSPTRAAFTFPAPAEGETRLPLFLRDGRLFLGAIPIAKLPTLPRG